MKLIALTDKGKATDCSTLSEFSGDRGCTISDIFVGSLEKLHRECTRYPGVIVFTKNDELKLKECFRPIIGFDLERNGSACGLHEVIFKLLDARIHFSLVPYRVEIEYIRREQLNEFETALDLDDYAERTLVIRLIK